MSKAGVFNTRLTMGVIMIASLDTLLIALARGTRPTASPLLLAWVGAGRACGRRSPAPSWPASTAEAMVTVRPATVAHAAAMGQLVVRAWQAAYRGQMPDDCLNGLRAEDRAAYWDGVLRREDRRGVILVTERDGEVVGFAAGPVTGPPRCRGAVRHQRRPRPLGRWRRPLLGAAQAELDRMGFAESVLWVLPGNARARRFYERAGCAQTAPRRPARPFGVSFNEVRYRRRSASEAISSASPARTDGHYHWREAPPGPPVGPGAPPGPHRRDRRVGAAVAAFTAPFGHQLRPGRWRVSARCADYTGHKDPA